MKNVFLIPFLTILVTSCGKGGAGGGNSSPSVPTENNVESPCNTFLRTDSLIEVALKSHKADIECKLSEEEIVKVVKNF